ncbi:hypothetical protein PHYSODRAFT_460901, partial [Phytophthora sojae]
MEGLKCEKLFGPVDSDDVNLRDASDTSDSESDADDEDVMADNVYSVEGVDDLDDVPVGEDAPDTGMFDMTDAELREIVKSGWIMYDEEHSGELQKPAATDYYDGPWGPTRSAVAYAESLLAMFFYFLPKALWVRIANETNQYREQNISRIAASRRAKLLARQPEDPRVSVPSLEEIEQGLNKFKRIQPHEIVH